MSSKHFCDVCKKEFDDWDYSNVFRIDEYPGYGSKLDGEHVHFDLCCDCFDSLIIHILYPARDKGAISKS